MKHSQRFHVKWLDGAYDGAALNEEENWFGSRVKNYRERAGLSQLKLAEEMEVSLQTVRDWERGEKYPHLRRLLGLARVLGVEVGQFFPSTGFAYEVREAADQPQRNGKILQRIEENLSKALDDFRKIRKNQGPR